MISWELNVLLYLGKFNLYKLMENIIIGLIIAKKKGVSVFLSVSQQPEHARKAVS